ncbi:MAG: methionine synthase, partial [Cyanobacteria bacterium J06639_1]
MTHSFLQLLQDRVVVFDGPMGTSLQNQNLTAEDFGGADLEGCNEYLVISKPEAVKAVHASFFKAGVDVVETDTFGATSVVLAEYDISDRAYEINRRAAELAKEVAEEYSTSDRPRFVAGSMGPGTKLPTLGHIDFDTLRAAYIEQVQGLIDGGADLLLLETCQDVLQIKAGLSAIEAVFAEREIRLPLMVSVTMEQQGTMLVGSEISAALTILEPYSIDILGLNCATGPDLMTEHIRYLSENSPFHISCIPNAGLPENIGGVAHYHLSPDDLKTHLKRFVEEFGVRVVGGCCGTCPSHLKALVEAVKPLQPKERHVDLVPSAASIYSAQPYDQDNSFLIVGERLNASGSKKCREMLQAEDWDGLVSLGRSQEKEGAHILDVNVDYVGRDGVSDMHELVSRLVSNIRIPLMLDSTEWEKMEAGLKVAGGKCLLNSTNYEDGEPRFFKVLELARTYGAGIVVGTIDEDGMARTADKKFEIAQRAYRDAVEFGIPAHEIFFDPLALPISTGIEEDRANGKATIESIRRIRTELPGCHVILGVSNVSFGLNPAARQVLNSVFLHEAVQVGMDSAIVSARKILPLAKIDPEHQEICRKLIYDDRQFDGDICTFDPLTKLTELFEGVTTKRDRSVDDNLPLEDKLKRHIIDGERIGLDDVLKQALDKYPPLEIVNTYLLDGMKTVGELFGSGQMQLPFVLQSAETMKAAVAFLEPHMDKVEGSTKGKMLIATVKGDVHDIGKNLVDIILTNNGYTVFNLGIKQPVDAIINAFREHEADCIAMSGLLVKSTAFMKQNLEIFNEQGISVPVILGGAALTRKFVEKDCQDVYQGRVIYGRDAFTDLHFMDRLMAAKTDGQWDNLKGFVGEDESDRDSTPEDTNGAIESSSNGKASNGKASKPELPLEPVVIDTRRAETVEIDTDRPTPPFWGTQLLTAENIPWEEVFYYIDRQALFAGQWQIRKPREQSKDEFDAFVKEKIEPVLAHWQQRIIDENLLKPSITYGYFPCLSDGNQVRIYQPEAFPELRPDGDRPGL